MKPGHSTPAPDDVCAKCGFNYNTHTGISRYCPESAHGLDLRLATNSTFAPSPAPGVAQHNSVKDMQDVFPGKQPEAISTNTAGVAATSDDAVNFDGSPVTVTDRIIPFNQILANRPEWDEKQRPVSGVAATTGGSTQWTIRKNSEKHIFKLTVVDQEDDAIAHITGQEPEANAELIARAPELQKFKEYVHKRLDDAGIEKEPNGEHSKHGCRIGDRLDIVLDRLTEVDDLLELVPRNEKLEGELAALKAENESLQATNTRRAEIIIEANAERDRLIEKAQEIVRVHNDMLKSDDEDDHFRFYALIKELAALADKGGLNQ